MPTEDQYHCTNRYCEDYVDGSPLAVGSCNRSHTTVPNEQPGSLWNGEIVPLANMTIGGALWCEFTRPPRLGGAPTPSAVFLSARSADICPGLQTKARTTARTPGWPPRDGATHACSRP